MDSYYNKSCTTAAATKQAKKISISVLVISLPLLYASLLHVPPSSLLRDTAFWFLISNSIIFIVAADFASSSAEHTTASLYDEYINHNRTRTACPQVLVAKEEVIIDQQAQDSTMQVQPEPSDNADQKRSSEEAELAQPDIMIEAEKDDLKASDELRPEPEPAVVDVKQPRLICERSRSELVETNAEATKNLLLPRSATAAGEKRSCGMEETEYWKMSDEELNNRVEEFIRRFNREIRLQERQMSAVY